MALGDNTLTVARGNSARGRQPYYVQGFVNFATAATDKGGVLAAADVIPALTVPANHVILAAGLEVSVANVGGSSDVTLDLSTAGGDIFVDGFDYDAASVGDYGAADGDFRPVVVGGTADNLDVTIATATTAPTGGEVRVWAVLMDIDDSGSMVADEVSRDLA